MKKNYILFASVLGSLLIFLFENSKNMSFCADSYTCIDLSIQIGRTFLIFPLILIFSLITYFAPERVFASWWKFARIAIPAIFIPVLLINLEVHHNPNGDWQDIFDVQILMLLYSIFTIGSVWQIWKGWRSN